MAEIQERRPSDPVGTLQEENCPQDGQQQTKINTLNVKGNICPKGIVVPQRLLPPPPQGPLLTSTPRRHKKRIQIPDKPFRFLDLPPELRNKVYQFMVSWFTHKHLRYETIRKAHSVPDAIRQLYKYTRGFLRTNKQIWRELLPLFLQTFEWKVSIDYDRDEPHPTTVIPYYSWLKSPSTHYIYVNVRLAIFYFQVDRADARKWAGRSSVLARSYRNVSWAMSLNLMNCEPYWRLKIYLPDGLKCYSRSDPIRDYYGDQKVMDIKERLHRATAEVIEQIVQRKKSEGDHMDRLSKGDWREVMVIFYESSYAVVAELWSDDIYVH